MPLRAMTRGLDRREAMRVLLDRRGDMLLVTGLGSTTWDAAAVGDDARNFYLWGAMGAAAMVGLGLAIAQPEAACWWVTGDGGDADGARRAGDNRRAMSAEFGARGVRQCPPYAETGMQPSHTDYGVSLCGVARQLRHREAFTTSPTRRRSTISPGLIHTADRTLFARIAIQADEPPRVCRRATGVLLKNRFRRAIGCGITATVSTASACAGSRTIALTSSEFHAVIGIERHRARQLGAVGPMAEQDRGFDVGIAPLADSPVSGRGLCCG